MGEKKRTFPQKVFSSPPATIQPYFLSVLYQSDISQPEFNETVIFVKRDIGFI